MPWALGYKRFKKDLYLRLVERRCIEQAAALICTDVLEKEAIRELGLRNPVYIVPNGLDMGRFANLPPRGEMRRELRLPEQAVVVLVLGRLHPVKRPDLAVQAFARIAGEFPHAHLVFAGPDEAGLESLLSAVARQANCAERVHFTGLLPADRVLHALADADLLLMPSESENFGMAAAEAMAAGLPVVISNRIGISRFVGQANAGIVVPLTEESIADGLGRLLKQPEKLREIGARARKIAEENFELSIVARRMSACYAEILSRCRQEHIT